MEPEYMNLEELLAVEKPDELMDEPPMRAKVLDVRVEMRPIRQGSDEKAPYVVFVVRRLATKTEDGWRESLSTKPFGLYYKKSKRKNSKYGKLIEALWQVAPDLMQNAKTLKDLAGAIFEWEMKTIQLGNISNVRLWLPVKLVDVEPVTEEEQEMLRAREIEEQSDKIAEEFAKEVL